MSVWGLKEWFKYSPAGCGRGLGQWVCVCWGGGGESKIEGRERGCSVVVGSARPMGSTVHSKGMNMRKGTTNPNSSMACSWRLGQ